MMTINKRAIIIAVLSVLIALCSFRSPIPPLNILGAVCVGSAAYLAALVILDRNLSPVLVRWNFRKIGLLNHVGEIPYLVKREDNPSVENGMILEFQNRGIPVEKWLDEREKIECALNIFITKIVPGKNRRRVIIEAVPADMGLPDMAYWRPDYLNGLGDFTLALGQGLTGLVTVNLAVTPHVLIGGSTGSGKSILLKLLLMQAIKKDASVYIADFKGGVDYPGVWKKESHLICDEVKLRDTLKELVGEMETRKEILRNAECANIKEYNERIRPIFRRIIIACDEVAELLDKTGLSKEGKEKIDEITGYMATIARQGRAFGLHLILATQRPDATILPGQIKNNIDCRICGRADNVLSMIILDNADAADQIPKDAQGRFLMNDGTVFQGFIFGEWE